MASRRTLAFQSLDDVFPEANRLIESGYEKAGNWTVGQICRHLASTFLYSIEGFPDKAPWLIQQTVGRIARRKVLGKGVIPEGVKVPDRYIPQPGLDDRAEAEALRAAIDVYQKASGPFADHPLFGKMSRADWDRLHSLHSAHHFSFTIPKA